MGVYRIRGRSGLTGEPLDLAVDGDHFVDDAPANADVVFDGGWILPGFVDAHNHVGIAPGLGVTIDRARGFAHADAQAGALLIREVGSPLDTHPLDADSYGPRFVRSGKHIARTKRYIRGYGIELDDPDALADEVRIQARAGDGWVKLVGDWIDRDIGDLAPLWTDEQLRQAVAAAHAEGARITAHVFGTDALHGIIAAGVDCIEHGTGLTGDLIDAMATQQIALVPTMIQVDNFLSIADSADRFPTYAAHMRALHASASETFANAAAAGVPLFTGTDAGGFVEHGRIVDEIERLAGIGIDPADVLDAATTRARQWLNADALAAGDRADALVFDADPRADLSVLRSPTAVISGGAVIRETR